MKILKKVISFILSAAMLCTIANVSVSADAPMYFDGITTNVFDQDFGDITSTSQASDFAFTGNWVCTGEFVTIASTSDGTIKTKNNIDLTGAYGYEFSVKMIMKQNNNDIFLAYNEADSKGYKVNISKKESKISLYRAGNSTALKTATISVGYGTPYVWTARLEGGKLTIKQGTTTVLEYPASDDENPDTEAASLNGIFGIKKNSDEDFAVLNMKLDKLGQGVTVNDWRYEKKFSSKDTAEGLAADGITTTCSASTGVLGFSDTYGINYTNTVGTVNFYYDKEFTGDFTVETQVYTYNKNAVTIRFNEGSGKYYALRFRGNKSTNNIAIVNYDGSATNYLKSETYSSANVQNAKYEIKVKDNGESINVIGTVYSTADKVLGTVTHDIAKTDLYSEKHKMHINTGNAGTYARIYYFNVYSTPSGETKTRDVSVINKEFVTGDTVTSLNQLGLSVTTPTSISNTSGGINTYGNTKDGMYWNNSNSSGNTYHVYVTCQDEVSGDYTFTATTKAQQNATTFQINRTDANNQYEVAVSANSHKISITKTEGGETTGSASASLTNANGEVISSGLYGYGHTTTIKVTNNADDKTLTIKADVYAKNGNIIGSCEYKDTTGTPFTSGLCRVYFDKNQGGYRMLYDMKITKHETYTDVGDYEGNFYIDGEAAASYEKGEIYFETPVVDLGTYTVVAALYEDNEMTGLKTFTTRDMCEGKLRLFNTSGSTAKESYVKVYLLDSIETLNKTMSVWTLK